MSREENEKKEERRQKEEKKKKEEKKGRAGHPLQSGQGHNLQRGYKTWHQGSGWEEPKPGGRKWSTRGYHI